MLFLEIYSVKGYVLLFVGLELFFMSTSYVLILLGVRMITVFTHGSV